METGFFKTTDAVFAKQSSPAALVDNPGCQLTVLAPFGRHVAMAMHALELDQCREHPIPKSANRIPNEAHFF
jgi:hypothetical protein